MLKLAKSKLKTNKHVLLPCFLVVTTVNFRKGYFHVILFIFILREND